MNRSSATLVTCLALLLSAGAGCGRSVNMKTWQKDVETYVEAHDNDPAVLRDVMLAGDRRGFGAIDDDDPRKSKDAHGVLVAHESVAGRPWFVYLVGIVDEQQVEEIRLAALSIVHGKTTWRVGGKDGEAFRRYRDHGRRQWEQARRSHGDDPPPEYTTFPRDSDVFDATVSGSRVHTIHPPSGARWEVELGGEE